VNPISWLIKLAFLVVVGSMLLLNSYGMGLVQALKMLLAEMLGEASFADSSTDGAVRGLTNRGAAGTAGIIGRDELDPVRLRPSDP